MTNLYFILLLALSFSMSSQDQNCGTDIVMEKIYKKDPALKIKTQKEDQAEQNAQLRPTTNATYVIPIVFHILHLDGPENITDAQVKDALRILNRDFAKANPDTTEIIPTFKNLADSMKIQFALATIDPQGYCTNGINHYHDPKTDWYDSSTTPQFFTHTWDPTKYLNIYVVRKIVLDQTPPSYAGYTYFPGSWPQGHSADAVVVLNNYFGSIGTGSGFLSRILTHEVAHWLNVYHVFGVTNNIGTNCTSNDFVSDTPPTNGYVNCPDPAIPSQYQICTPGISENFQNYMEYSYCCRMFTPGQRQRMHLTIQNNTVGRGNLVTLSNLLATGVINPNGACVPIADFKCDRSRTCFGTPVTFTDASWRGAPTSYSWSFPGGTPASSTSSVVSVTYGNPGTYSVIYTCANSVGSSTPISKSNVVKVTPFGSGGIYGTPWFEGFEHYDFDTLWTVQTSSGGSEWQTIPVYKYTGYFSVALNHLTNGRKCVSSMISPMINISLVPNPHLSFMLAAAEDTYYRSNTLNVYYSTDCSNTWHKIYSKSGQALVTTTRTPVGFYPLGIEWRLEDIDLQQISPLSFANFKFEYVRDTLAATNQILIDDINIMTTTSVREIENNPISMSVFPVPSDGNINISFYLEASKKIRITLVDLNGRYLETLTDKEFQSGENNHECVLKNKYAKGMYFLRVEADKVTSVHKIILKE